MITKSNGKQSSDLVVRVWLSETAANHVDAVAQWVAEAVSVAHAPGPHPVVSGTLHNDEMANGVVQNCIEVAVHAGWLSQSRVATAIFDNDELVVIDEPSHNQVLCAQTVCATLPRTDLPVIAIGVSAVSSAFCREMWLEIVEPVREWMQGMGLGQGRHRQHMFSTELGAWSVSESSSSFTW